MAFPVVLIVIPIIIGIMSAIFAYAIYKKTSLMLWAYTAGTMSDWPHILALLKVTNIGNVLLLSHTIGILAIAVILVIVDIFLIELSLLKYLSPFKIILKPLKPLFLAERVAEKLEGYKMIPPPERIKSVFIVSLLAGIIHLIINLVIGMY